MLSLAQSLDLELRGGHPAREETLYPGRGAPVTRRIWARVSWPWALSPAGRFRTDFFCNGKLRSQEEMVVNWVDTNLGSVRECGPGCSDKAGASAEDSVSSSPAPRTCCSEWRCEQRGLAGPPPSKASALQWLLEPSPWTEVRGWALGTLRRRELSHG